MVRGKPGIYRLLFGLFKPKNSIPGIEFSGKIEKVGKDVSSFEVGDGVYGDISGYGWGTFSEYVSVRADSIVKKPENLSFEWAAATSHAAMLAYQGLFDAGHIREGMKLLINGAGGGMGTFALQIAKRFNCEVTGVDAAGKLETMKSLGFDHVLDYAEIDFTKNKIRYDLILDAKTTRWAGSFTKCLNKGGKYVTVGGDLLKIIQVFLLQIMGRKHMEVVGLKQNKDLKYIHDLYDKGLIKPIIDGPYPLEKAAWAFDHFGAGRHKGKVLVSMLDNGS